MEASHRQTGTYVTFKTDNLILLFHRHLLIRCSTFYHIIFSKSLSYRKVKCENHSVLDAKLMFQILRCNGTNDCRREQWFLPQLLTSKVCVISKVSNGVHDPVSFDPWRNKSNVPLATEPHLPCHRPQVMENY